MRGAAGDDFKLAQVLELPEGGDEIAAVLFLEHEAGVPEQLEIHSCQGVELGLVLRAFDLLPGKLDQPADMTEIALLEQRIGEHGDEGRRQAHGEAEIHAVVHQSVEYVDKRNVGLGDRLVQPVFFEKPVVLGVAHIRQMAVQNQ